MKAKSYLPYIIAGAAGAVVASLIPLVVSPSKAETKLLPFQGRLTDAAGTAFPDGAKVVEFKMYDAPTGGNLKNWAGEVHKLSVNGGLVNTMLGTKASLGSVDFSTPTYLQITIDAQATGAGHGVIDPADPPLLPRQSVVPALYAVEAGNARNLSAGDGSSHDWSALFGTQNPAAGTIPVSRVSIQNGEIPASAIAAANGIGENQLGAGSVDTIELKDNSVTAEKIKDGEVKLLDLAGNSVGAAQILDGNVSFKKRAARSLVNGAAGAVGDVVSASVTGAKYDTSHTDELVGNALSVTLQTNGGPVFVTLTSLATATSPSGVGGLAGNVDGQVIFTLKRDDSTVSAITIQTGVSDVVIGPGCISYVDMPPAGTHSYKLYARVNSGDGNWYVKDCSLVALEW